MKARNYVEQVLYWLKVACAGVSALASYLWGSLDGLLAALIALVVIDYLSGIASAYINKELSSGTGVRGIFKKVMYFGVVAVAHICDNAIGLGGVLRSAVIGFFVANEGISILENAGNCGLPIPKVLLDALAQLRSKGEDTE